MHTKSLLKTFLLLLSIGINTVTYAEPTDTMQVLTLQDVLLLAEKNNYQVLKSIQDVKSAKADNQQALAGYLPSVELSNTYSSTNDPLYSFGSKLQQQIVTAEDFNPALLNNPGTTNHFATEIKVEQPIINLDAWLGKGATAHMVKATELQNEYTKNHVMFAVKKTYFALQLANNRHEVISKALEAAEAYLKLAEDNLKQGYLKEADVLSVKVRVLDLEAQKLQARNQIKSVSEMLNFLMGRSIELPIKVADSIEKTDYNKMNKISVLNRADVQAMQNGMEAQKLMRKSNMMKFLPRINGFGMYHLYDSEFAGFNSDSWMLGINLQWKLFNGGQNIGKYNKSKAQFQKSELAYHEYLDKGNMELMQAKRNINIYESQLLSYQMAASQAKESLRIRSDRFKEGLEKTSDLLNAEATYAESELKHLNAIYEYNISVFRYELLSSESEL